MKKQAKLLFEKSVDSLILSISHFNNPWDRGRKEAVLILLDRAFELLLKSIILHKGGKIRETYAKETIGHEKCVRKCISQPRVKCLTEEQGLTIQIINSLRDAAQHDIVELSEQGLYMYSQAGVTLFRDLLRQEFNEELKSYMPERVLLVSTEPPRDLHVMVEADFKEIQKLLKPNSRRQIEAKSKLKSLSIIEASLQGVRSQPGEFELRKMVREIKDGKTWQEIFPGVASLQIETTGTGINVDIRITKKEGGAVHLVPEGTPGATVLAIKRVNELDYYSLGAKKLAEKVKLSVYKLLALIWHLKLQDSDEYFKILKIGSQSYKRYSKKAYEEIVYARTICDEPRQLLAVFKEFQDCNLFQGGRKADKLGSDISNIFKHTPNLIERCQTGAYRGKLTKLTNITDDGVKYHLAKLRLIARRTLKQYGYPPDMQKLATVTVLKQAELIANEIVE